MMARLSFRNGTMKNAKIGFEFRETVTERDLFDATSGRTGLQHQVVWRCGGGHARNA